MSAWQLTGLLVLVGVAAIVLLVAWWVTTHFNQIQNQRREKRLAVAERVAAERAAAERAAAERIAERTAIGERAAFDCAGNGRDHRDFEQFGRRERRQDCR